MKQDQGEFVINWWGLALWVNIGLCWWEFGMCGISKLILGYDAYHAERTGIDFIDVVDFSRTWAYYYYAISAVVTVIGFRRGVLYLGPPRDAE